MLEPLTWFSANVGVLPADPPPVTVIEELPVFVESATDAAVTIGVLELAGAVYVTDEGV